MKVKDGEYGIYIDIDPAEMEMLLRNSQRDSVYTYYGQSPDVDHAVYVRVVGPSARAGLPANWVFG